MKTFTAIVLVMCASAFTHKAAKNNQDVIIANGRMPNMVTDHKSKVHIVYGSGDSIMYLFSANQGRSFSKPALVAVLPGLFASAMRGPQIALTEKGIVITANTRYGNMYAYPNISGKWHGAAKINDLDSVSKEALMSVSADGLQVFAVWLDCRAGPGKGQRLYGAASHDGGRSWSQNKVVYASPDGTICECCKPSVIVKGDNVYAMFRNRLLGFRDMYLIRSPDGGRTFGQAEKLGTGSWKLDGCPMDGGGLTLNSDGTPETVWRRDGNIYAASPGKPETALGQGRSCAMESVHGKQVVYTWTQDGAVVVRIPSGRTVIPGKGSTPVIKALDNAHAICVWEQDRQIHASVVEW